MRILRFISVLWFCGFSAFSQSQSAQAADSLWIDVRSEQEVKEYSVEGAHNIPHTDITDRITELATDKNTPIHLFCRSGKRANQAQKALQSLGYTNVINEGGYIEASVKLNTQP